MIKVFLIEDHHIMRRGLASLLVTEREVQILGEAASGEEALELLQSENLPDLIVMDVSLPGMNGVEATRRIKSLYKQIKILVLSVFSNPAFVQQAMEAGASGYILKKSMVEELNMALDQIMQGQLFISPLITDNIEFAQDLKSGSFQSLTNREIEVFEQLGKGRSVKDIAKNLVVSIYTVYTHMNTIKRKLGVEKNSDLIRYAIENPLVLKHADRSKGG
jgi:DNA-binding NarL/FixJ family response regulator